MTLLTSQTSKEQLLELARRLKIPINAIVYVDQLKHIPAPSNTTANYIINLRNPAHWVALHIDGKKAYYFNSFAGIMPVPKEVIQFLKKSKCMIYYTSDRSVQKTREGFCGEFALDFLMYVKRGSPTVNYKQFLSHLENTTDENVKYLLKL